MLSYIDKTQRIWIWALLMSIVTTGFSQSPLENLVSSLNPPYNSTCLLIFDGSYTCSGFLINDGFKTERPLILTAGHCLPDGENINSLVTIFGRRKIGGEIDAVEWSSTIGARLLASSPSLDYALFELDEAPPKEIQPFYLGWNQEVNNHQVVYGLHHPSFDFQQTVVHNNQVTITTYPSDLATGVSPVPNGHWQIKGWQLGETTIGSSGSALVDTKNQALGVLSGGQTSQFYGIIDYYSRMDLIIADIKQQTSQVLNLDKKFIEGFSSSKNTSMLKISNYNSLDTVAGSTSLYAGEEIIENFPQLESGRLEGIYISVNDWNSDLLNDISVFVRSDGHVVYEENVNLFDLNRGSENYISLVAPQEISGNVSIGLQLNSANLADEISLFQSSGAENCLFFSLLASNHILKTNNIASEPAILIYPNPSTSTVIISAPEPKEIKIIDMKGQIFDVNTESINKDQFLLDISFLESGTYFLQILTKNNHYFAKKIVLR